MNFQYFSCAYQLKCNDVFIDKFNLVKWPIVFGGEEKDTV